MIFSLLNIRKKTAAALSGIAIAAATLWGLALWQDISVQELLRMALATLLLVGGIAVCAILMIAVIKLFTYLLRRLIDRNSNSDHPDSHAP